MLKIPDTKAGGVIQVVESLPSKCEALSSVLPKKKAVPPKKKEGRGSVMILLQVPNTAHVRLKWMCCYRNC
jgi:hypothetical protein